MSRQEQEQARDRDRRQTPGQEGTWLREDEAITPAAEIHVRLERLGVIMRPDPSRPEESGGVLNPASARGRDGHLYLLPRVVEAPNYSRVGIARVLFGPDGAPCDVERLGIALEPREEYERNPLTGGGVEDPRITYSARLDRYLMTYVAYGPLGARVALAASDDLFSWTRLGVVDFATENDVVMNTYVNKDAVLFPEPVRAPDGSLSLCMMHRPVYVPWDVATRRWAAGPLPIGITDARPSIWLSYAPLTTRRDDLTAGKVRFSQHTLLAGPVAPWEGSHIGGGTPFLATDRGWLTLYHGVERTEVRSGVRYSAGVLLLDRTDPRRIIYRGAEPILEPQGPEEQHGVVSDVVFPTAMDAHDGLVDVYYGMADAQIGAARLHLALPGTPSTIPHVMAQPPAAGAPRHHRADDPPEASQRGAGMPDRRGSR